MDLHQIHTEGMFVPHSDMFEGQRSRSPGTKNGIFRACEDTDVEETRDTVSYSSVTS